MMLPESMLECFDFFGSVDTFYPHLLVTCHYSLTIRSLFTQGRLLTTLIQQLQLFLRERIVSE